MTFVPSSSTTFVAATARIVPAPQTTRIRRYSASAGLQLLLPGETAAPGTATGKTGTPSARTAGTSFSVTVNVVDANWNVLTAITDTVAITSTESNATLPANAALVAGTQTFSVTLNTAGTFTVTASDVTDTAKVDNTSPTVTVNPGAFTKLQLLVDGEVAAPGTSTGKTSTPNQQTAGNQVALIVNAVDAKWNVVSTVTDTIAITSSDSNATLPSNHALAAGTYSGFLVTPKTAGAKTVTATDATDGAKTANTSPSITINAGTFAKVQLLVPSETAAAGTATGKTGTPDAATVGTPITLMIHSVDAFWNVVSSTNTIGITSTDGSATLPSNAALVAGTKTFSFTFGAAGSFTITATNVTDGSKTANTSPGVTVGAGSIWTLLLQAQNSTSSGSALSILLGNTTGADFIPVPAFQYTNGGLSPWGLTCTDDKGNTYAEVGTRYSTTNYTIGIFFVRPGTVGSNHHIILTPSDVTSFGGMPSAWSGSVATPLDQVKGDFTNSGTSKQIPTQTPAAANELILAVCLNALGAATINSSFGAVTTMGGMNWSTKVTSAAAAPTWDWSGLGTTEGAVMDASFKHA